MQPISQSSLLAADEVIFEVDFFRSQQGKSHPSIDTDDLAQAFHQYADLYHLSVMESQLVRKFYNHLLSS